jgi:hypothetical protein
VDAAVRALAHVREAGAGGPQMAVCCGVRRRDRPAKPLAVVRASGCRHAEMQ